jgi:hypothetical protein
MERAETIDPHGDSGNGPPVDERFLSNWTYVRSSGAETAPIGILRWGGAVLANPFL